MGLLGKVIGGFVVTGLVLYGVAYAMRQKELSAGSSFKLKSVKPVGKISATSAKVIATIEMKNNTDIDLTIWSQTYRAYLNNKQITDIKDDKQISWNRHSTVNNELTIEFNPTEALGQILTSGVDTVITVVGSVQVQSGIVLVSKFPVEFSFSIKDYLKV